MKAQALAKLKFEIDRLIWPDTELNQLTSSNALPPFYKLRLAELQKALTDYYYLHSNADAVGLISTIYRICANLDQTKRYHELEESMLLRQPYRQTYADLSGFLQQLRGPNNTANQRLSGELRELKDYLEKIKKLL